MFSAQVTQARNLIKWLKSKIALKNSLGIFNFLNFPHSLKDGNCLSSLSVKVVATLSSVGGEREDREEKEC